MYVCICNSVTDRDIQQAIKAECGTFEKMCRKLKVGSCCGRCQVHAKEIVQKIHLEAQVVGA